jgi:signal transduction histidine kinase
MTRAVFRAGGDLFAQFRRSEADPLPSQPLPAEGFHSERLELVRAVRSENGALLGTIYLRGDPAREQRFVRGGLGIAAAMVLLATGVALAFAAALEHRLTGPVHSLIQTVGQVRRQENFALRAPAAGTDELGQLINAFNDMLAQIQLRDVELRRDRDHLGEWVAQRTAELMQLNHALFQARDKAEDGSRAKSSFLANMSHELRTPLNAIKGYSETLMEEAEVEGRAEALADLQRIHAAGMLLPTLVNEVLDLSQIEAGKMTLHYEGFDLVALVREVFDTVRPQAAQKQNRLEVDAPPGGFPMRADHTKVRQTLINLLSNGCKFTERGVVRLQLTAETVDGHPWAVIQVSDTGIGLSEEQLGRLFQAFTQADTATVRKFGGTGLA